MVVVVVLNNTVLFLFFHRCSAARTLPPRLCALPADTARQLHVLGHDGHALGVDGAH